MKFEPLPIDTKNISDIINGAAANTSEKSSEEKLKLAFSCIDLTTLNPTDTVTKAAEFTQKVNEFKLIHPDFENVAAICVYPNLAKTVKEVLADDTVKVASVAGGFPSSMTFKDLKVQEALQAVTEGADEIDIVLPLWAFLDENYKYCFEEIKTIKDAIGDTHLKVILESGVLENPELIWKASLIALEAGADFIKTSTGKLPKAATPEAAVVMCEALKWWDQKHNQKRGFKPAGGISTSNDVSLYLSILDDILGKEWQNKNLFRIGASRLANNLLSDIFGKTTTHF